MENIYRINNSGIEFIKSRKKETYQFFYLGPIFIFIISYFSIEAFSVYELEILGIIISLVACLFFIKDFLKSVKTINKVVCEVKVENNIIELKTFKAIFINGQTVNLDIRKNTIKRKEIRFTLKTTKEVWIIKTCNREFFLIQDFFDSTVIKELQPISHPN